MPTTMPEKRQTSFRLSGAALSTLANLSARLGVPKTSIIEIALRESQYENLAAERTLRNRAEKWRGTGSLSLRAIRLTEEALEILHDQAERAGVSRAEVLEMLILRKSMEDL